MIRDFEAVKKQLKELASIVNSFSSEAVQLRVIELVFGMQDEEEVGPSPADEKPARKKRTPKKKAGVKKEGSPQKARKKATTAKGPAVILSELAGTDFFESPRAISEIVEYCETNYARRLKSNQFSPKLGRMVRDGELTREKNANGQYEYKKA